MIRELILMSVAPRVFLQILCTEALESCLGYVGPPDAEVFTYPTQFLQVLTLVLHSLGCFIHPDSSNRNFAEDVKKVKDGVCLKERVLSGLCIRSPVKKVAFLSSSEGYILRVWY